MAEFNPDTGLNPDGQSMLGYAGNPAPGNKALATLFGGAGDLITQGAAIADSQNLFDIKNDAQAARDAADKQFGYDVDSVPNTVGSPTNTPPELSGAAAQLSKLQAAKAQGKLTDSHYWALLQSNVKDLKAKYAGYSDQIDNIVQSVTGGTPANQLRASVDAYNQRLASAASESTKSLDNWAMTNQDKINQLIPGFQGSQDPRWQNPDLQKKIIGAVGNLKATDDRLRSQDLVLSNADKNNQANVQQATNIQSQAFSNAVQTSMSSLAINSGIAHQGEDAFQALARTLDSGNISPDQLEKINSAVVTARAAAFARIQQAKSSNAGMLLDTTKSKALEDAAMAPFDILDGYLHNKDYGAASRFVRSNEYGQSQDLSSVRSQSPIIRRMMLLPKVAPTLQVSEGSKQYTELMGALDGWSDGVRNGVATPDELHGALTSDMNLNDSQRSAAVTKTVKQLVGTIADPSAPNDNVLNAAKNIFNGGSEKTWAATSNKSDLLNTLIRPEVVDRVASLDQGSAKDLAGWAFSKAQGLPEIRQMATEIANARPFTAQYVYNPKTFQFLPGSPVVDAQFSPDVLENQREGAQVNLIPFNRTISNLAHTMVKAGIDPNDPNDPKALPAFLKQIGGSMGQKGDIPSLQKAMDEHSDTTAIPEVQPALRDTPTFDFLSDPGTAEGFKSGELGDIHSIIRQAEAGKSGYDASIDDGGKPRADYSKMTVSQVFQQQASLPRSKAIGAYQFIPSTLHYAVDKAGIKLSDPFNEETQDKLATVLMEDAGLSRWKAGKLSDSEFQNNLAAIWAGLPETSGMSHYNGYYGNKATVGVNDVQSALKRSKG